MITYYDTSSVDIEQLGCPHCGSWKVARSYEFSDPEVCYDCGRPAALKKWRATEGSWRVRRAIGLDRLVLPVVISALIGAGLGGLFTSFYFSRTRDEGSQWRIEPIATEHSPIEVKQTSDIPQVTEDSLRHSYVDAFIAYQDAEDAWNEIVFSGSPSSVEFAQHRLASAESDMIAAHDEWYRFLYPENE